jgi:hypothetical protein
VWDSSFFSVLEVRVMLYYNGFGGRNLVMNSVDFIRGHRVSILDMYTRMYMYMYVYVYMYVYIYICVDARTVVLF